ncbi:MAG: ribosomal RNA small subunit methyltransferase A [Cyanobacteria bacterium SZAS LIN-3]|nr:ribosomal RNA small subunit methyltransferase A [Cyanobacteria bacterium SZAS LIN-3]MBS2006850.1 ribosomal RNA small subunit methyltransferase A [Cyanobacteria bacterium SZAS TMP-1]
MLNHTRESLFQRAITVRTKKKLGQNFLVEPGTLDRIVDTLNLSSADTVLEIGPGLGFLTERLCETGARVYAVELDRELLEPLNALNYPNLTVIHGDFLEFDINQIKADSIKVVGNVPYQITTPIIAHVFGEIGEPSPWQSKITSLTMTVQIELARRICAPPGIKDYGQLTLLAQYCAQSRILFKVGNEEFIPKPEVQSAVIEMTRLHKPPVQVEDPAFLRRVIVAGFKERRKMLKNNLSFTKLSEAEIIALFAELGISPSARAENLSLPQFAKISQALAMHKSLSI